MAETFVQLPPNSTGIEIRAVKGDGTNQIPSGVTEEALIVTDAQGLFAGDARQMPQKVELVDTLTVLRRILATLERIELVLKSGFDEDVHDKQLTDDEELGN